MATIERHITIDAAAERVFDYVADLTRHPEWAAHELRVERSSEGPVAAGSMFSSVGHQMGEHKAGIEVTEFQPNSRIVYECEDDTGKFRHSFAVQGEDGGTRLTKGAEAVEMKSLMLRLMSPLLPLIVGMGLNGDLKRIKAKLEVGEPAMEPAAEQPPAAPPEAAAGPSESPETREPGEAEEEEAEEPGERE